jgi:glycosyltransferase involved in cell wall biosynthesis
MLISIIILTLNEEPHLASTVDSLAKQPGDCEVIVVDGAGVLDKSLARVERRATVVSVPAARRGVQLNAGAAVACGEILLFLDSRHQLPAEALLAIERNLKLLPQTIGGNFHLKFANDSLFAKLLVRIIKWWRYRGSYGGDSGIFVRKDIYEKIGGFQPDINFADYDFVHRMEKYGPTLYLHEAIVAPMPDFRDALTWLIAPILVKRKT